MQLASSDAQVMTDIRLMFTLGLGWGRREGAGYAHAGYILDKLLVSYQLRVIMY